MIMPAWSVLQGGQAPAAYAALALRGARQRHPGRRSAGHARLGPTPAWWGRPPAPCVGTATPQALLASLARWGRSLPPLAVSPAPRDRPPAGGSAPRALRGPGRWRVCAWIVGQGTTGSPGYVARARPGPGPAHPGWVSASHVRTSPERARAGTKEKALFRWKSAHPAGSAACLTWPTTLAQLHDIRRHANCVHRGLRGRGHPDVNIVPWARSACLTRHASSSQQDHFLRVRANALPQQCRRWNVRACRLVVGAPRAPQTVRK
mmetsp:Transcript_2805/g.6662  ORF Transcript_2805/g.6662 Transcript_2805/m.6662 type:complete len:263 (+) Transcript_2805:1471-2259(+)